MNDEATCPQCRHPLTSHMKTANLSKRCWTAIDNPHRNYCECGYDPLPSQVAKDVAHLCDNEGSCLCDACIQRIVNFLVAADHPLAACTVERLYYVVNVELLRLLEEHHLTSLAESQLHPTDDKRYVGTKLCLETIAVVEKVKRAKAKV